MNWNKIEFIFSFKLHIPPSELERLEFYRIEYILKEYQEHVEKENKANLVIIGLAYLFSKDINSLPDKNILKHTLIRFKMHETYYHFLIKHIHLSLNV